MKEYAKKNWKKTKTIAIRISRFFRNSIYSLCTNLQCLFWLNVERMICCCSFQLCHRLGHIFILSKSFENCLKSYNFVIWWVIDLTDEALPNRVLFSFSPRLGLRTLLAASAARNKYKPGNKSSVWAAILKTKATTRKIAINKLSLALTTRSNQGKKSNSNEKRYN